jgi:GntR family galactonate operon transcriptional repressor
MGATERPRRANGAQRTGAGRARAAAGTGITPSASPAYALRGLHGQVVDTLGHRIVSGELSDQASFDLAVLEQELGVSRTVLREALKVLAAKGLVDARPKRGTFVRPRADWNLFDPDVLRWEFAAGPSTLFGDLAEVRKIVEPAAARLAAERRSDEDLVALDAALAAMVEANADGDPRAAVDADVQFHRALAHASHNELLLPMQEVVLVGLRARDLIVHSSAPDPEPALDLHGAVRDAVRDRQPEEAEQLMHRLLAIAVRDSETVAR